MSYVIKGFCVINAMTNNIIGDLSPIGELSDYSRTFSTVKTLVADPAFPQVSCEIFSSKEDGILKSMPVSSKTILLTLLDDIIAHFVPTMEFNVQFASRLPHATLLGMGESIGFNSVILPTWIRFSLFADGEPIEFKIWFADAAFKAEYDEYEIRILPPVPSPQDLSLPHTQLMALLDDQTYASRINDLELLRNEKPCTKIVTIDIKWSDPQTDFSTYLPWTLIVFGPHGLIREHQLDAIKTYLENHTDKDSEEWEEWFPEINVKDTLIIIPLWDRIALRGSGSISYMHSPCVTISTISAAARMRYNRQATELELSRTYYTVCEYKSVGYIAIGESDGDLVKTLLDHYPDYTMINLNDMNANRLSAKTRNALYEIERAIRIAESATATSTIPEEYRRTEMNGYQYLTYNVDGVTHHVMTKTSYLTPTP